MPLDPASIIWYVSSDASDMMYLSVSPVGRFKGGSCVLVVLAMSGEGLRAFSDCYTGAPELVERWTCWQASPVHLEAHLKRCG